MVAFLGFLTVAGLGIFGGGANAATVDNNQTIIESLVDVDGDFMVIKKTYRIPATQVQSINNSMHLPHASLTTSIMENKLVSVQIVDPRYFDCDVGGNNGSYSERCVERSSPKSAEEQRVETLKAIGMILSPARPAVIK